MAAVTTVREAWTATRRGGRCFAGPCPPRGTPLLLRKTPRATACPTTTVRFWHLRGASGPAGRFKNHFFSRPLLGNTPSRRPHTCARGGEGRRRRARGAAAPRSAGPGVRYAVLSPHCPGPNRRPGPVAPGLGRAAGPGREDGGGEEGVCVWGANVRVCVAKVCMWGGLRCVCVGG